MQSSRAIFLLLVLAIAAATTARAQTCNTDDDCPSTAKYCAVGSCTAALASVGDYCQRASDCASFPVLGALACSDKCGVAARCGPLGGTPSPFCCAGIPANGTCNISWDTKKVIQCASGLQCLSGDASAAIGAAGSVVCGKQSSNRWLIGVVISVGGSVILNVGLNIQKFAFRKNEMLAPDDRLPAYKLPLWVFGFSVWIVGNLSNFVALSFAAQSLIASLGAVSLVSNAIAAPLINAEPFGIMDLISILFISGGTIVVVLFSNHDESTYSLCALMQFYTQLSVIAFLSVICGVLLGVWFFIKVMEANQKLHNQSRQGSASSPRRAPNTPVSAYSDGSSAPLIKHRRCLHFSRLLQLQRFSVREDSVAIRVALPFSYACMGGALGGLTVMFAKSAAELISLTLQGDNQFASVVTYAIFAGIIVTGGGQIYYINEGIRRYDALLQVPAFYVVCTFCFCFSFGGVYFNEFASFSPFQFGMFVVGVSLTFVGVAFLTGRLKSADDESEVSSLTSHAGDSDASGLDPIGEAAAAMTATSAGARHGGAAWSSHDDVAGSSLSRNNSHGHNRTNSHHHRHQQQHQTETGASGHEHVTFHNGLAVVVAAGGTDLHGSLGKSGRGSGARSSILLTTTSPSETVSPGGALHRRSHSRGPSLSASHKGHARSESGASTMASPTQALAEVVASADLRPVHNAHPSNGVLNRRGVPPLAPIPAAPSTAGSGSAIDAAVGSMSGRDHDFVHERITAVAPGSPFLVSDSDPIAGAVSGAGIRARGVSGIASGSDSDGGADDSSEIPGAAFAEPTRAPSPRGGSAAAARDRKKQARTSAGSRSGSKKD
ncbi:magnesium transporter NIPA-domain-containing protein [Blastocladiella britannica]|nr:magnesium transporter NIPA-domain-containing protein [Blastocladiella britannica]